MFDNNARPDIFAAGCNPHSHSTELEVLHRRGVSPEFETGTESVTSDSRQLLMFYRAKPTVFGIMLYMPPRTISRSIGRRSGSNGSVSLKMSSFRNSPGERARRSRCTSEWHGDHKKTAKNNFKMRHCPDSPLFLNSGCLCDNTRIGEW